jgi:hypothetical protein
MDWIELAQDKERWQELANVVMKLQVSFSRRTLLHGVSHWRTQRVGLGGSNPPEIIPKF